MAATLIEGVELDQRTAKKLVQFGIDNGAYESDMPTTKKGQIEAAHEVIAFCMDGWKTDGVRPDDDDPDIQAAAKAILKVFKMAGIEVNEEDEIILPGAEEEEEDSDDAEDEEDEDEEEEEDEDSDDSDDDDDEDDEDEEEEEGDEEEPFDPDSYFKDGWSELTAQSKLKQLKALDTEDEDDLAAIEAVHAWEKEQDKPSSRVLNWIEENFDLGDGDDEEEDADEDSDDAGEVDGTAVEEPWDGFDKLSAVDIKKTLDEYAKEGELTVKQVEYVMEYEEGREKPPTRKRVVEHCKKLIEALNEADGEAEEDEKPAKKALAKGSKAKVATSNGVITITREQILAALSEGEVEVEIA